MSVTATACSSCREPLAPSAQFCRACGTPVGGSTTEVPRPEPVHASPTRGCLACGGTLAPDAAFCRACGAPAAQESPTLVAPEPYAAAPVPVSPDQAAGGGRSPWFAVGLVALVLIFGGGGGAAAYVLVLKKDGASNEAVAKAPAPAPDAPPASDAGGDATATADSSAEDQDTASGSAATTSTGDDASEPAQGGTETATESPEAVLRSHFEDIDAGNYQAAWRLLHPAYRSTTGVNWVRQRERERANIDVRSISRIGSPSGDVVKVEAEIVAADSAGPGAGICRLFSGWTRMEKSGGSWMYRPGEIDGVTPGFSANATELDSSDSRCSSVLD